MCLPSLLPFTDPTPPSLDDVNLPELATLFSTSQQQPKQAAGAAPGRSTPGTVLLVSEADGSLGCQAAGRAVPSSRYERAFVNLVRCHEDMLGVLAGRLRPLLL